MRYQLPNKRLILAFVLFCSCILPCHSLSAEPVSISIWVMPIAGKDSESFMSEEVALFKKDHPDIDVHPTVIDWLSAWDKIMISVETGEGPDIIQLGTTWVPAVAAMNALVDLTEKAKESGAAGAYNPATWSTCSIQGRPETWAIPWYLDLSLLFCRSDVFQRLGLSEKDVSDWTSFKQTCRKIRDAGIIISGNKTEPLGFASKEDWQQLHNAANWIWSAGGDFLSADFKHSSMNSPKSAQGVLFLMNLAAEGYISRESLNSNILQVQKQFSEGRCAMIFGGPWVINYMRKSAGIKDEDFFITQVPEGPGGRHIFFGGSNLAVFRHSKHPEESWKFIKFLSSYESQVRFFQKTGNPPALKQALSAPTFSQDVHFSKCIEAYAFARPYPNIPSWGLLESVLLRQLSIMWQHVMGTYGPYSEEAIRRELDITAKKMNEILNDTGQSP
jgi:multiple sugar transport system substrate-binding protein